MPEISKEEYAMGQFLKHHGEQDPSRAGIMLQNVAKALVISAQKRYVRYLSVSIEWLTIVTPPKLTMG